MRILWLCRWFGNYRIPVYKELNRLTNGQFYMAYSKDAITPLVHRQMRDALGDNAIALEKEKHFTIGKSDSNFDTDSFIYLTEANLYPYFALQDEFSSLRFLRF